MNNNEMVDGWNGVPAHDTNTKCKEILTDKTVIHTGICKVYINVLN